MKKNTEAGFSIGARLRHAREERHLSLGDVEARTGLSKGFLSRVERDQTSPSVASLIAICDAISMPMDRLFLLPRTALVRASERNTTTFPGTMVHDTLVTTTHETRLTVIESVVAAGGTGGRALYALASECELCYVIEGEIELNVDGALFYLHCGDALTFDASTPHTWRNCSTHKEARILWILTPALPDPQLYVNQALTEQGVSALENS